MSDRSDYTTLLIVLLGLVVLLAAMSIANVQDTAYSAGAADALCAELGGEIIKGENNSVWIRQDWKATCVNLNTNEAWLLEAKDE